MKPLVVLTILFLSGSIIQAQYGIWTDPVPITDSVTDNKNGVLAPVSSQYFTDSSYIAWEKSVDTITTAIWVRNLRTMTASFSLLAEPGIHFRNPIVIPGMVDTLFYMIYETNQNGNWDVYSVKYHSDGSISLPSAICVSLSDEKNFTYTYNNVATWQKGDSIMTQLYTPSRGFLPGTQSQVLDHGNCQNPVFSVNCCAWEKVVGIDLITEIWGANRIYSGGQHVWTTPYIITEASQNANLFIGNDMSPDILVWQTEELFWDAKVMNLSYLGELEFPSFPGCNNTYPCFIDLALPVEGPYPFQASYISWASDHTGNKEIYVNEELWSDIYINISEFSGEDTHPRLYSEYSYSGINVLRTFLLWESFRNDHWQLWITYQDIPLAIPDQLVAGKSDEIKVIPNPFSTQTAIEFKVKTSGPYFIDIYSSAGQQVHSFSGVTSKPGKQQIQWTGSDNFGNKLPTGIYLIKIQSENQAFFGRVMLQKD